jgi:hypothetical protein
MEIDMPQPSSGCRQIFASLEENNHDIVLPAATKLHLIIPRETKLTVRMVIKSPRTWKKS